MNKLILLTITFLFAESCIAQEQVDQSTLMVNPIRDAAETLSSLNKEYFVRVEPFYFGIGENDYTPYIFVFNWVEEDRLEESRYVFYYGMPLLTVFPKKFILSNQGNFVSFGDYRFNQGDIISIYSKEGFVGFVTKNSNRFLDIDDLSDEDIEPWICWSAPIEIDNSILSFSSLENTKILVNLNTGIISEVEASSCQ